MKTFNVRYRSDEKLRDFIYEKEITDANDILIQLFTHHHAREEIEKITQILRELLPSSTLIGTSTDGEMIDGRILTNNTIISITVFEHTRIKCAFVDEPEDSYATAASLSQEILCEDTQAVILFVSDTSMDGVELLEGLKSSKKDFLIAGGLCGDGGKFEGGSVICNDNISKKGVVAVSLNSDKLYASNRYTSEWEPVGREFKITKSNNSRIYTVDKMSVYALYEKYLGEEIAQKLPLSSLQFPFVFKDEEDGGYIARSVRANPKDGSLIYATKMKENQTLQIAFGNAQKMLQNTQNLLKDVQKEPIESTFVYASSGRRRFLQGIAHAEVEPYKSFGMSAGYYGYGEFFSDTTHSKFLNQSMTFLTLSESLDCKIPEVNFTMGYKKFDMNLETTKALTNIAKVSSQELQELNQKLEMRVKEEVQKSRDKDSIMIHNAKLAQMGEMMSLIAHQWRQPLSAISAASTGLQIKIELDRYDEKLFLNTLEKIEEYVYHLSQTIDDFADFFKPSKKKEQTSLTKLVDKALFILSSSFTKNSIEVETIFEGEIELSTYSNEVIQVLINLLKNAETILLKREIKDPKITLHCYQKNGKKYIEILDNAGGIDDTIIHKIFESYFTTKENDDSTGLGLYMSKFIIEDSCKGKLEVKNENGGAKFTIVL